MKPSKILELAQLYRDELVQGGAVAKKMDENHYVTQESGDQVAANDHLVYACDYIKKLVDAEEYTIAILWLGFVQGATWRGGNFNIEELRRQCVPNGYDPVGGGGGTGRSDFPAGMRGED